MRLLTVVRGFLGPCPPFVWGILIGGVVGVIVGFIVGLFAYPPTAWAAAIELGMPAALASGLVVGIGDLAVRTWRSRNHPAEPPEA